MSLKSQARQLAQLQTSPEIQALLGLKHDANTGYNTEVAQAIATAAGLKQGAKEARPVTQRTYNQAEGTRQAANALATNVLNTLPGDSPFRAAFGIENAGARTRFGEARAGALHELTQRGLEAQAGQAYDIQAAGAHRRDALSKIGQQLVGARAKQGLAYATTLAGLRADRAKQQHQSLADAISLGNYRLAVKKYYHPNSASSGGKVTKDAAGVLGLTVLGAKPIQRAARPYHGVAPPGPHVTPSQAGSAASQLSVAVHAVQRSLAQKVPASALRGYLETGYTTPNGAKIPKITGAGPVTNRHIINAAFDIAKFGTIRSRETANAFRGVRLPPHWRPHKPRRARVPGIPLGGAWIR